MITAPRGWDQITPVEWVRHHPRDVRAWIQPAVRLDRWRWVVITRTGTCAHGTTRTVAAAALESEVAAARYLAQRSAADRDAPPAEMTWSVRDDGTHVRVQCLASWAWRRVTCVVEPAGDAWRPVVRVGQRRHALPYQTTARAAQDVADRHARALVRSRLHAIAEVA